MEEWSARLHLCLLPEVDRVHLVLLSRPHDSDSDCAVAEGVS